MDAVRYVVNMYVYNNAPSTAIVTEPTAFTNLNYDNDRKWSSNMSFVRRSTHMLNAPTLMTRKNPVLAFRTLVRFNASKTSIAVTNAGNN